MQEKHKRAEIDLIKEIWHCRKSGVSLREAFVQADVISLFRFRMARLCMGTEALHRRDDDAGQEKKSGSPKIEDGVVIRKAPGLG